MFDLLIRNCIIVNGGEAPFPGSVGVSGEKIAAILQPTTDLTGHTEIDGGGQVLLPGVIDPHVHYRYDYGYRDSRRDYLTETRSALIGGVTTAIRMHREAAPYHQTIAPEIEWLQEQSHIDMAFHIAVMTEAQLESFSRVAGEYGINSFKLYLAYRGRAGELQGIAGADDGFFYEALRRIGRCPGGISCVHAENSEITERLSARFKSEGRADLQAWAASRPGWTEGEAIFRAGYIAHHAECPLYVVHVSSAEGIEAVEQLRQRGIPVHAEVCIHHLTATMDIDLGLLAKVTPPLRSERDVAALWSAVERGVVDTIATDHVAHSGDKLHDSVWDILPGFPGSATMLPALLTHGYHTGRLSLSSMASLVSRNAARIFGLRGKGEIVVGADADLVLLDLDAERTVDACHLLSSSDYSLYDGQVLKGWPQWVVLRGEIAMCEGRVVSCPGSGKFIRR